MKFNYIRLLTDQFTEMTSFYRDKMGFNLGHLNERANYAEFHFDTTAISLFDRTFMLDSIGVDRPDLPQLSTNAIICINVNDLDEQVSRLKDKGLTPVKDITNQVWGTVTAHFADPDGNLIEFYAE